MVIIVIMISVMLVEVETVPAVVPVMVTGAMMVLLVNGDSMVRDFLVKLLVLGLLVVALRAVRLVAEAFIIIFVAMGS